MAIYGYLFRCQYYVEVLYASRLSLGVSWGVFFQYFRLRYRRFFFLSAIRYGSSISNGLHGYFFGLVVRLMGELYLQVLHLEDGLSFSRYHLSSPNSMDYLV